MFKSFNFEVSSHRKKSQGLKLGGARRLRNVFPQGDQTTAKHFLRNGTRITGRGSILSIPEGISILIFFHIFHDLRRVNFIERLTRLRNVHRKSIPMGKISQNRLVCQFECVNGSTPRIQMYFATVSCPFEVNVFSRFSTKNTRSLVLHVYIHTHTREYTVFFYSCSAATTVRCMCLIRGAHTLVMGVQLVRAAC